MAKTADVEAMLFIRLKKRNKKHLIKGRELKREKQMGDMEIRKGCSKK